MKRSVVETVLGGVVLLVAIVFLGYGYRAGDVAARDGYSVYAHFSGIGGLQVGDDVQVSGVKVGRVAGIELTPDTYLARVALSLDPDVKLPVDTAALISSESLLGGMVLQLEPGADDVLIPEGGLIEFTQAPQNLEQLLGQFIFSMQDDDQE